MPEPSIPLKNIKAIYIPHHTTMPVPSMLCMACAMFSLLAPLSLCTSRLYSNTKVRHSAGWCVLSCLLAWACIPLGANWQLDFNRCRNDSFGVGKIAFATLEKNLFHPLLVPLPPRAQFPALPSDNKVLPQRTPHPHILKWPLAALMWVLSNNCIWLSVESAICASLPAGCEHVCIHAHSSGKPFGAATLQFGLKQSYGVPAQLAANTIYSRVVAS